MGMRLLTALLLGAVALLSPSPTLARDTVLTVERRDAAALRVAATQRGDRLLFTVREAGRVRQRFSVQTDVPAARPSLSDVDGDGVPDLWVPTMTGNANALYAIWRLDPATGRFAEAGEIGGIDFRRDGGFLVVTGRNGCCGLVHEFHRFAGDRLQLAFTIDRQLAPDDDQPGRPQPCTASADAIPPPPGFEERYCRRPPDSPLPGQPIR